MTEADAIFLAQSRFWEQLSPRQRATFQLYEDRLCMPFHVFLAAMQECLGRPVYTHEFASSNRAALEAEFRGDRPAPTLDEIMALIPADKRVLVVRP